MSDSCEFCLRGSRELAALGVDLEYGPDPFANEIHDDGTPMWICSSCWGDRKDEV